ncbi:hypothetical protein PARMER_04228 [Parabacteroides merdae ATCC 43184]|nr:hypothetical protein PARMER_04228 [Parabacteroides merdae ATCC 43184]
MIFYSCATISSCRWHCCFLGMVQSFHAEETTVSCYGNSCAMSM